MRKGAMGLEFIIRKSDGVRVHYKKTSNGLRVDHEKRGDGVGVDHEKKERCGRSSR